MSRLLATSLQQCSAVARRRLHTAGPLASMAGLPTHRDTEGNDARTPFEFSAENMKKVDSIKSMYPLGHGAAACLPVLDLAQRQHGWLPIAAMHTVADILEMPRMRVYEVATFYSMYYRQPVGKYHVQVCGTTPCMLRGAEDVIRCVEERIGAKCGSGPTADGRFSLSEVECLGACVNAPMMQVNDDYYEDLTVEDTGRIVDAFASDQRPHPGPQSGRLAAEPISGLTTLTGPPPKPGFGMLPDL